MENTTETAGTGTIRGSEEDYLERRALFDKLIKPHLGGVYSLAIRYTMKGGERVDENYQAALENLFLYIKSYNPELPIKTWIHICTKRHIMQLEKENKCTVVSGRGNKSDIVQVDIETVNEDGDIDDPLWNQVSGYDQMGSEKMVEECISDDLLEALNSIQPLHKRLILMSYDGLSHKEIAQKLYEEGVMSKPDGKIVKSKMNTARQNLRKLINRDGKRIV